MRSLFPWLQKLFNSKKRVLIVDDEDHIREELGHFLRKKYRVFTAASREEARKILEKEQIHFAVIDLNLDTESEYSGLILLDWLLKTYPKVKPLILSAYRADHVRESDDFKKREKQVSSIIEQSFISKGVRGNYIEAVVKHLERENDSSKT